jgi:hypothetical protein
MEDGYLPNLKAVFENGHMIHYGLYHRLKEGWDNSTGDTVGWEYYDRDKERIIKKHETFFNMLSYIPRRARVSFLYGIPGFDSFMFLPLLNVPELLETYGVVEFIWFTTDAIGHVLGHRLYRASIRRFDRYFGDLVKRLNFDELNIIIYCDHGMSFGGSIVINQNKEIKRIVGDDFREFRYPNLYLENPDLKDKIARDIILGSEIDFAFYRENPHQVIGYSDQGKVIFEEKEGKIRYLFEGEDSFGYYNSGYKGEWLTALDWLAYTRESRFPAAPPNIYKLLLNKMAGDILIVINPPKIIRTGFQYMANHAGITNTDLMMPILLKGPQLEHLYDREEMWLHNLYTSIPELNFNNLEPVREKNSFSFWGSGYGEYISGFEMSLSPAYRWNFVFRYSDDIYHSWLEYDLYSSYVIRLWTGAGLQYQEQSLEALVQTRLQIDLGKIQLNYGGQFTQDGWEINTKKVVYQVNDRLALEWLIPNGFGMSFSW